MTEPGDPLLEGGRFIVGRQLGQGGMGMVFEAYDRHRDERVALKTLVRIDGAAIYRLKKEFRSLANVAHENLVSLYELFSEDGKWFFTMELVEGVTFLRHVRPPPVTAPADDAQRAAATIGELDEARLRSTLRQLAQGVHALHAAGKVHRDVKPSNVMVDSNGRVVLLDLGISGDLRPELAETVNTWAPGTAHYMSPEQVDQGRCTAASDWYSVGVLLYEALTGTLPFKGPGMIVMFRKQQEEPAPVLEFNPDAPRDLATLCDTLVSRNPAARPDGTAVLLSLGAPQPAAQPSATAWEQGEIVGRETHLSALQSAFQATRDGRTVTVYVHGPSGMGKSTLVEHFLSGLVTRRQAVVLRGQCYDRESVPYKALDGVVDSLSHYLATLAPGELKALVPPDLHMVARLFPVLRRINNVAEEPHGTFDTPDPIELRRRAVAALRGLLTRLAAREPLVIHVDDLQWTDTDSIALGSELLRSPQAPPLLLILSFRSEEIASKPFLRSFIENAKSETKREFTVGPLTPVQSAWLAESRLGPAMPGAQKLIEGIVREAGGSPFFIEQLANHMLDGEHSPSAHANLGEMIDAKITRLPTGARQLLQTLAVVGRPVDFAVAHRAAGLTGPPSEARALVGALRVSHMIRPSVHADRIELYHDRIREAIVEHLEPEQIVRMHGRLAQVLSEMSADDPEALFVHYLAAGEKTRAGEQAARAAERATEALAFDRAVTLFRKAIDLGSQRPMESVAWQSGLAKALANAGRPGDSAQAFLEAAEHESSREKALEHRRSAAEQFLIDGRNDQGLEVTRGLLREVGLRMPASPRRVLLSLLLSRVRIRLRGLGYTLHATDSAAEIDLLRMDICWACAIGLTMTDYILAAYFQARYLLLALEAGEPHRITRALAFEVGFVAAGGGRARKRTEKVGRMAQALADQLGSSRELGMVAVTIGSASCLLGDFKRSAELCGQAEQILRERCTGVQWELTTCRIFLLTALTYLGETREIVRRVPALIESAQERGNLFEGIELRTRQNLFWLLNDDPREARRELSDAMARWSHTGFYRQDYNSILAETNIDLYIGEPSVAWARFEERWGALRRSQLLRVQFLRCESLHLRGRVAVAAAARGHARKVRLRVAERVCRKIVSERISWAAPFVPLLRAGIASTRGDDSSAAELLASAVAGFEVSNMGLYAAVSRHRLGEVLSGDEGAQLVRDAESFMRSQSVTRPRRLTAMLAPGFPD